MKRKKEELEKEREQKHEVVVRHYPANPTGGFGHTTISSSDEHLSIWPSSGNGILPATANWNSHEQDRELYQSPPTEIRYKVSQEVAKAVREDIKRKKEAKVAYSLTPELTEAIVKGTIKGSIELSDPFSDTPSDAKESDIDFRAHHCSQLTHEILEKHGLTSTPSGYPVVAQTPSQLKEKLLDEIKHQVSESVSDSEEIHVIPEDKESDETPVSMGVLFGDEDAYDGDSEEEDATSEAPATGSYGGFIFGALISTPFSFFSNSTGGSTQSSHPGFQDVSQPSSPSASASSSAVPLIQSTTSDAGDAFTSAIEESSAHDHDPVAPPSLSDYDTEGTELDSDESEDPSPPTPGSTNGWGFA